MHVLPAGSNKDARQCGSIQRLLFFRENVADGAYTLRERRWPRPSRTDRRCGFFHLDSQTNLAWLRSLLECGAQPSYNPAALFGLPFFIERNEAVQDVFRRQVGGPSVGVKNGCVEIVVDLAQDGDETLLMDRAACFIQFLSLAEFFEHVVHAGNGECREEFLLAFTVMIESLAQ